MDEERIRKVAGVVKRQPLHRRMDWKTVWNVVEHFVLIMTEDDHSRKVVGGVLVPRDTAWHYLCVVRHTVEL